MLMRWEPSGARLPLRSFYYSRPWQEAHSKLGGIDTGKQVRWWDDEEPAVDDEQAQPFVETDPAIDPSPVGHLNGLIETFVCGSPRAHLVRKIGFGMEPPFVRMRPPRAGVVEMRTRATRSFGFFVYPGVYVAHQLDLADNTHRDPSLYKTYGDRVVALLNRMDATCKDETSDIEFLIGSGTDGK